MLELAGVYAIYDHPHPSGLPPRDVISAMLAEGHGAQVVQLRAKTLTTAQRRALAEELAACCHAAGVPLFVNDDLNASTADVLGVKGVHVGQRDLQSTSLVAVAKRLRRRGQGLGVSTHTLDQVRQANACEVQYIGFGPVFPTRSKVDAEPVVGLDGLAHACRVSAVPVVAIGGISLERVAACRAVGAKAVAVIRALGQGTLAEITTAARSLRRAVDGY